MYEISFTDLKPMCGQDWFLLEDLGENVSLPFLASRGYLHALAHDPFFTSPHPSSHCLLLGSNLLLPPSYKDIYYHNGPTWTIQANAHGMTDWLMTLAFP